MSMFDSSSSRSLPQLGDEAGFVRYEERFIFDLQQSLRQKPGMENKLSVLELCAELEEHIYKQVQERLKIEGVPVWSRFEALDQFLKLSTDTLNRVSQNSHLDWSALYDEHHSHVPDVFEIIFGRKAFHGKSRAGGRGTGAKSSAKSAKAKAVDASNATATTIPTTATAAAATNKKKTVSAPKKSAKKAEVSASLSFAAPESSAMQVDDAFDDFDDSAELPFASHLQEDELLLGDGLGFDFDGDEFLDDLEH
jgi:hypothetical protein